MNANKMIEDHENHLTELLVRDGTEDEVMGALRSAILLSSPLLGDSPEIAAEYADRVMERVHANAERLEDGGTRFRYAAADFDAVGHEMAREGKPVAGYGPLH